VIGLLDALNTGKNIPIGLLDALKSGKIVPIAIGDRCTRRNR
jgi:hypothetical protein